MTALNEYERLEASALWRPSEDAQRIDVIVSIGDATLTISDMRDRALTHWSLPAVTRANPGKMPAIYHPDGDTGETLELPETEHEFIAAMERLLGAIARQRPHPGRLRLLALVLSVGAVILLGAIWLPEATRRHAVEVVPEVKRAEIGQALLSEMQDMTGPPCRDSEGMNALQRLAARLQPATGPMELRIVRGGVQDSTHLLGGTILLNRKLVEDHETPDIVAGYIIAEQLRARRHDPLDRLLQHGGILASLRLLATGNVATETLRAYAEHVLTAPRPALDDATLLRGFEKWRVRATPYAYARDISGETTLGLIEADPHAARPPEPVLADGDWLRLQGICGG
ncbi:hypothetical protein [Roseovarius sp. SYSU LYC5161]|uniref:hypothetical protein n=1 Tax=Roseovarius halophilus (ex Wu et al. 2025) TaxID=3376060 RepID=UPI0028729A31|nr:hypothetical protein [Roseovarius sp.]